LEILTSILAGIHQVIELELGVDAARSSPVVFAGKMNKSLGFLNQLINAAKLVRLLSRIMKTASEVTILAVIQPATAAVRGAVTSMSEERKTKIIVAVAVTNTLESAIARESPASILRHTGSGVFQSRKVGIDRPPLIKGAVRRIVLRMVTTRNSVTAAVVIVVIGRKKLMFAVIAVARIAHMITEKSQACAIVTKCTTK